MLQGSSVLKGAAWEITSLSQHAGILKSNIHHEHQLKQWNKLDQKHNTHDWRLEQRENNNILQLEVRLARKAEFGCTLIMDDTRKAGAVQGFSVNN